MHLLVRERHGLDEEAPAQELGHSAAPIVVMSFSDADLAALAAAWVPGMAAMRLAPLGKLRHPMSVDLYLEQVVGRARCVVVRLLGGVDYWRYGVEEVAALCRARGIALAVLPGDGGDGAALRALSTVDGAAWAGLDGAFRAGGPGGNRLALAWMAHLAGLGAAPGWVAEAVPAHGVWRLDLMGDGPLAAVVFYRSHFMAGDLAPVEAVTAALRARGFAVGSLFAGSLKAAETGAWVAGVLRAWGPAVVLNATAFSSPGVLEAAGAPVLQLVLSGARRADWAASSRGLSPADLAMHVVLPEMDGRLLTGAVSFKAEGERCPALEFAGVVHGADAEGVALAADRAAGWARLAAVGVGERRVGLVLSDYPGIGGQRGHAVGLDTFASAVGILEMMGEVPALFGGELALGPSPNPLPQAGEGFFGGEARAFLSVARYLELLGGLPEALRGALAGAWGAPEGDAAVREGWFTLRYLEVGGVVVALQPERGGERRAGYHDPDLPPRHVFVAFYLWLREVVGVHALVHLGAHGSLEWLPGKAAALSAECWPRTLVGGVPVIYPFIVNNPGEAAAAKRRLGAVTIGHMTPPLGRAGLFGAAAELEQLIDEYAAADGLDRRRAGLLRGRILELAAGAGLLGEAGAGAADEDEALARLDAYLCDVKDLQVRDGLHVFGAGADAASAAGERAGLLAALAGRFLAPGPAGAPSCAAGRGRPDVLPTGRNMVTTDPRTVPTRTAVTLAERAAEALLRRHLAEQGDWPRRVVLDLWGSATMRTGGEDLALAFVLLGARPVWDEGSARVSGFEVLPLAVLDRPRVDVTLRVSGLFRDAFAGAVGLFDALVRAVAGRDEAGDWNPLAGEAGARVFGPAPGQYGAGDGSGAGWAAASGVAYRRDAEGVADPEGLRARLAGADAFVHAQDHAEQDLLDSPEWAAHEGGFYQAAAAAGGAPAMYHLDASMPEGPRVRTVREEVVRVVRGRAANPAWIAGMMRHGYRGAAEIVRPLAALEGFARTLPERFDAQFELIYAATIGCADVDAFLARENPAARADLLARFAAVQAEGLWHPRRNAEVGA